MSRERPVSSGVGGAVRWVAAALSLLSCTSSHRAAAPERDGPPMRVAEDRGFARLVVLPADDAAPLLLEDPSGTRRSVVSGMRVVEEPDGSLRFSEDVLIAVESLRAFDLPARLGGGVVFVGQDDGETLVWRADDFTAPLTPLGRFAFETASVAAGFDRLYVVAKRTGLAVAVDPKDGAILDVGALPAGPAYGALAFADPWLAGVEVDIRGPLVTFDAGLTWHPLGVMTHVPAFAAGDGALVVSTPKGRFSLGPSGRLERVGRPSGAATPFPEALEISDVDVEPELAEDESPPHSDSISKKRYVAAVLSGVTLASGEVAFATAAGYAQLRPGEPLTDSALAAEPRPGCQGGRLGTRAAFVCQDGSDTSLRVATASGGTVERARFPGSRSVVFGESGRVVVRGGCGTPRRDAYCVMGDGAEPREVQVHGDVGVERVVALADGRVVVLVPPRFGSGGSLAVVSEGAPTSRKLDLSSLKGEAAGLAETGLWLEGPVEVKRGRLAVWVVGATRFVGLRIAVGTGKVTAGPVQEGLVDTHFAGAFALSISPGGALLETVDGGIEWDEVRLPGRLVESMRVSEDDARGREPRGCSAVGCVLGNWVRFGWGTGQGAHELAEVRRPEQRRAETPLYTKWNLVCEPDGRATRAVLGASPAILPEPRRLRLSARASGGIVSADVSALESSAFRPFLGYRPPARPSQALAFDFGTEEQTVQVRGYAWGPRDAAWDRHGRWLLRVADRFGTDAPWSTSVTATRWPDAIEAARRFGSDPSHRHITRWHAWLDPDGEQGLLRIQTTNDVELYALRRNRPIVSIDDPQGLGAANVTGVVVVNDDLYVGSVPSGRAFRIARVQGREISLVGTYPRYTDAVAPRLVRATSRDALGVVTTAAAHFGPRGGGGAWFVFPIDLSSGEALSPVVVAREVVSHLPRPCSSDDDGWLVEHDVSPSVAHVELGDGGRALPTGELEARLVVREGDVCLSEVATTARGGPLAVETRGARRHGDARPVSLVVNDPATDRRFGFRCGG